jgi:hypothetical protein
VTEPAEDHDIFPSEADDGRELAHLIIYRARVTDRFGVEDIGIDGRDGVCHYCL